MKSILKKIADILYYVPLMDKDFMMGILCPLDTEEQAIEMLEYLEKNKNDSNLMRVDNLLRKALEIGN